MLEDENLYVRAVCSGKPVPQPLLDWLEHELVILEELSRFDGASLRAAIRYDGFFPQWKTEALDLPALYRRHASSIHTNGYGMFARYHVFVVSDGQLVPVKHPDPQALSELYGYKRERDQVIANTKALLMGRPANNVLLYGDAGTEMCIRDRSRRVDQSAADNCLGIRADSLRRTVGFNFFHGWFLLGL